MRTDTIPALSSVFWYLPTRAIKSTTRVVRFWEEFGLIVRKDAPIPVTGYVWIVIDAANCVNFNL